MTPTPKLRFFERELPYPEVKTVRILQQFWAIERDGQVTSIGEWRDVPVEKEQS